MTDLKRVINVVDWLIFEKKVKSRRDLATKMGYTESSLSQILNNKVSLSEKFINKLSILDSRLNENWIITGEGKMLKSENKQGDNSISNSSIIGNTHVGPGNSINVSVPDKGFQKIIKPDGTIEIVSINSEMKEGIIAEGSSVVKNLQYQIKYLQDQIKSYKDIIEEQKGIIKLLKENLK